MFPQPTAPTGQLHGDAGSGYGDGNGNVRWRIAPNLSAMNIQ